MIALPPFIDKEAWEGFMDMRKAMKKPLTLRAAKMILAELYRIKAAGHDANAALDQSTVHNWCDVYQPKAKEIEVAPGKQVDETARYLHEQKAHAEEVERQRLARSRGKLRAVA